MGWQGVDPTTDFRAAGLLGLDNLIYLGRTHPALFQVGGAFMGHGARRPGIMGSGQCLCYGASGASRDLAGVTGPHAPLSTVHAK